MQLVKGFGRNSMQVALQGVSDLHSSFRRSRLLRRRSGWTVTTCTHLTLNNKINCKGEKAISPESVIRLRARFEIKN